MQILVYRVRSATVFTAGTVSGHFDLVSLLVSGVEETVPRRNFKLRGVFFVMIFFSRSEIGNYQ